MAMLSIQDISHLAGGVGPDDAVSHQKGSGASFVILHTFLQVDRNVEREICNHRMLNHPNIILFKEVGVPSC